jgi:hypothetical protein
MGKIVICSKYKILIFLNYINKGVIKLIKRFHMFDFIYYNNINYIVAIISLYYP